MDYETGKSDEPYLHVMIVLVAWLYLIDVTDDGVGVRDRSLVQVRVESPLMIML